MSLIALSARLRSVSVLPPATGCGAAASGAPASPIGLSIAMNHCGVLRKMTGFFERQLCGY